MYHQEKKLTIEAAAVEESPWTWHEEKLFEKALVTVPEDIVGRWRKIADGVPGKTEEQVKAHYEALLHDLDEIESGRVELPRYADDEEKDSFTSRSQISFETGKGSKHGESERKKGNPWTEEEHRKFLAGLEMYGKGDWRSISRNAVITRTPTQVASHAQKFFLRQTSMKKQRKRASIHDITTMGPPPIGGTPPSQLGHEYEQYFG